MLSEIRNTIQTDKWAFSLVSDFSIFSGFDCNDSDLNDFILNEAAAHKQELIAETYAFEFLDNSPVPKLIRPPAAFVSLLNDSIPLNEAQKKCFPRRLRYEAGPSVKIGRLGVDKNSQRQRIGTLVVEIIKEFFKTNNRTGCRYVTVDAYNRDGVLEFYRSNYFDFLTEEDKLKKTRTMYFDLKRFDSKHILK